MSLGKATLAAGSVNDLRQVNIEEVSPSGSDVENKGSAPNDSQKACQLSRDDNNHITHAQLSRIHLEFDRGGVGRRRKHPEQRSVAQGGGWVEVKDGHVVHSRALPNEQVESPEPDAEDGHGAQPVYRQHLLPTHHMAVLVACILYQGKHQPQGGAERCPDHLLLLLLGGVHEESRASTGREGAPWWQAQESSLFLPPSPSESFFHQQHSQ